MRKDVCSVLPRRVLTLWTESEYFLPGQSPAHWNKHLWDPQSDVGGGGTLVSALLVVNQEAPGSHLVVISGIFKLVLVVHC